MEYITLMGDLANVALVLIALGDRIRKDRVRKNGKHR